MKEQKEKHESEVVSVTMKVRERSLTYKLDISRNFLFARHDKLWVKHALFPGYTLGNPFTDLSDLTFAIPYAHGFALISHEL